MTSLIIFDLDGTLANGAHREHHIVRQPGDERPKDWDAYFAACRDDRPVPAIVMLYSSLRLRRHAQVEIWTGRIEQYRDDTIDWINEHLHVEPARLLMRETNDRTQDDVLKRSWLAEARGRSDEVILAFEDRKRVVEMWRAEGVLCCQVAPGEF